MSQDPLSEQTENESLRRALDALVGAMERASIPNTPEISEAIRAARRSLQGSGSDAVGAGLEIESHRPAQGRKIAVSPTMTINHEKVARGRLYRSEMTTQIILVTLLWNEDVRVDKDDLLASFAHQKFDIVPATLLSRLSKMRSDGLIAQRQRSEDRFGNGKYAESAGVYRLTERGLAAARVAAARTQAVPPV